MTGFTQATQAAMLDAIVNRTLYLRLFTGSAAGDEPNEDGTLPTGVAEVSGSGYAVHTVLATDWDAAVEGPPSTKQLPGLTDADITFTASGGNWGTITAWALTTDNDAYTPADCIASGPLVDDEGTAIAVDINDGWSFSFTPTSPLVLRLGDPAVGTVPF